MRGERSWRAKCQCQHLLLERLIYMTLVFFNIPRSVELKMEFPWCKL